MPQESLPDLPVLADVPDNRDESYQPALVRLESRISPPGDLEILNQGPRPIDRIGGGNKGRAWMGHASGVSSRRSGDR